MKKLLLIFIGTAISASSFAQCTPGANYADSTFGAWPDTTQNFPSATVDIAYVTDLNFKVPSDAGDIDPAYAGYTIESFSVDSVTGMPGGFNYSCNIVNCEYNGGANGCAQIAGTCPTVGMNNIVIYITANVDPGFGFTIPVPYSFSGYKIEVLPAAGVTMLQNTNVSIFPNPATDKLTVGGLEGFKTLAIYSVGGQKIQEMEISSVKEELNIQDLNSGIYFIHVSNEQGIYTQKFVKK